MPILLSIHLTSLLWEDCQDAPGVVETAVGRAWEQLGSKFLEQNDIENCEDEESITYEAGFVLSDDEFIQTMNRDYRGQDRPTNVLSFSNTDSDTISGVLAEENRELGDVIFAFETINKEAKIADLSLEDHLSHMAIHGFLHLLGYDHIGQEEAVEMENLERNILLGMGISDPYAENYVS